MKYSKWIGLVSVIIVLAVCYTVWVYIPSAKLEIGGMASTGKHNFGKPGLMNIICSVAAGILFLVPKVWAKRTNIFVCGFNAAWAFRNLIILGRCYSGECPEKQPGLYILLFASIAMLLMSFIPDVEIKEEEIKTVVVEPTATPVADQPADTEETKL